MVNGSFHIFYFKIKYISIIVGVGKKSIQPFIVFLLAQNEMASSDLLTFASFVAIPVVCGILIDYDGVRHDIRPVSQDVEGHYW